MHVWKLAVVHTALSSWSYADCLEKKKEKRGKEGCREQERVRQGKQERNEMVLYPRLDTMMMGTLRI